MPASVRVSLRIFGETLDPSEVSALLGCEPTRSQRKGEAVVENGASHEAETGAWFLESDEPTHLDIESQVESLLHRLTGDPDEWASLTDRYAAELLCGLAGNGVGERWEISPRLSRSLAKRGLVISFEVLPEAAD